MPYKLQSPSNESCTTGFQRMPCGSIQNIRDKQTHTGPLSSSRNKREARKLVLSLQQGRDLSQPRSCHSRLCLLSSQNPATGRVTTLCLDSRLPGLFLSSPAPCTTILNKPSSSWNISMVSCLSLRLWADRWESSSPGRHQSQGRSYGKETSAGISQCE